MVGGVKKSGEVVMDVLKHADSYKDLVVYEKARAVASTVFRVTKGFPKEETYSLTDQVRRASRSVGAQIAEAWAKRRYEKHFVSKLTDADGEQMETQHWLDTTAACGYLDVNDASALVGQLAEIGRMLSGMISKAHLFCGQERPCVHDAVAEYFAQGNGKDEGPTGDR